MKTQRNILLALVISLIFSCSNNSVLPININSKASFPDSSKLSPAGLRLITSFMNKEMGTTSALYGNSLAFQKSMNFNKDLFGGELFTLVTWKQQPDSVWFGSAIPGDMQTVELLKITANGSDIAMGYERYDSKGLALTSDTLLKNERIKFILDRRPSVMP